MAEAILSPQEQQRLGAWNRDQAHRRQQRIRQPARKEYGPRSYRQPSLNTMMTLARPTSFAVDDDRDDAADEDRNVSPAPAAQRVGQNWQGVRRGTGPQAEAVNRRATRYAQIRAERRAKQGKPSGGEAAIEAEAALFARQAYARLWDGLQEAVADLNIAFFGLLSLVVFPVQSILYFARLLSGPLGGYGNVGWRGLTVPRVPQYDWISGPYHSFRFVLNGLIFLIWLAAVVFVATVVITALSSTCASFGWLLTIFGKGDICNAT